MDHNTPIFWEELEYRVTEACLESTERFLPEFIKIKEISVNFEEMGLSCYIISNESYNYLDIMQDGNFWVYGARPHGHGLEKSYPANTDINSLIQNIISLINQ